MDFCAPMLALAESKRSGRRSGPAQLEFRLGDALNIPLPDASFDAVTIAFGLRNMADRSRCLSEIRRVLRPGGRLFVLEFSQPWRPVRPLYSFHLSHVVPWLAGILTGERGAYEYLRDSIGAFPGRGALSAELLGSGFSQVSASAMTLGVVALHVARR
jgi:demethylmenaquinone methyltransferase/2-methoxy-6-polyprenyl-1,4-benzoquinol methylase